MRERAAHRRWLAVVPLIVVAGLGSMLSTAEAQNLVPVSSPSADPALLVAPAPVTDLPVAPPGRIAPAPPAGPREQSASPALVEAANLEVVIDAVPEGPTDFAFTVCPADAAGACTGGATSFSLDDDDDPALAERSTVELDAGLYTVSQSAVPGWTLTGITCSAVDTVDVGRRRVLVDLEAAEAQSCRFTVRRASLSVTEDVRPDGAQDFAFDACLVGSEAPCRQLILDDDDDPGRSSTGSFDDLEPGVYTLTQSDETQYGLGSVTCNSGSVDLEARRVTVTVTEGAQVACTFTNQATTLAITVDTVPHTTQDFHFTACREGGECTEADLDDDLGPPTGTTLVLQPTSPGTYTVDQSAVSGWLIERITCDLGDVVDLANRRATIHLAQGETTTCVFVNRSPTIRVNLDAAPDDAQDFGISLCHAEDPCRTAILDDDGDPTNANTVYLDAIAAGPWVIELPQVAGWGLGSVSCGDADVDLDARRVTFDLEVSEQVNCDVVYRRTSLTIVQNTSPDGAQDFTFTGCAGPGGALGCASFVLDDDADPTLASSRSYVGLSPGTYSVRQHAVAGYGLTNLACSSGTTDTAHGTVTVALQPGDQVTCSFGSRLTSLTIVQDTVPNAAQDFIFTGCAGPGGAAGCASFLLDDDADPTLPSSTTFTGLVAGTQYSVAQAAVPGYGLVGLTCTNGLADLADRRATIVVSAGDQVTCTFSDRVTSIRIVQDTSPNSAQDFSYTGCAGPNGASGCGTFTFDDDSDATLPASDTFSGLDPGTTYTITQGEVDGYGLSSLTCTAGQVDLAARRATFVLAAGDQVTCTFTDVVTSLTVVQNTVPNGPQDFTVRSCSVGSPCTAVVLDDDSDPARPGSVALPVTAGRTYVLGQDAEAGYHVSAIVCTKGMVELEARRATIALNPGDRVTCTYTVRSTSLTIVQDTSPASPQDFSFTACSGPNDAWGCGTFALDDDTDPTLGSSERYEGLSPGTEYSVTQEAVPGFGLSSLTCDNGQVDVAARRVTIVLAPGEQVTCTFVVRATSVTIVQDTSPASAQDFSFTGCSGPGGALGCGAFVLDDDADPTLQASVTFTGLISGSEYVVTQAATPGFGLTELTCTQGEVQLDRSARRVSFTLEPGDQLTCTFTATETSLTVVHDLVNDGGQDFTFTACLASEPCESFGLDDDSDPTLPSARVLRSLDAATYTVTTDAVPGYGLVGVTCTTGDTSTSPGRAVVHLVPGRQATCTFRSWANQLTVRADVPTGTTQDFGYTVCGPLGCSHHLVDNDLADAAVPSTAVFYAAPSGEYTITQDPVPAGWGLVSITCHDEEQDDLAQRRLTVQLRDGHQIWCSFTNQQTRVTVVEDTVADAPRNLGFSFCPASPGACTTFQLDDDANATLPNQQTFAGLDPGTYTVTQDPVEDAVITSLSCGPGAMVDPTSRTATITLLAGQQTTCTFVNRVPSITVAHDAVPNSGVDVTYRFCRVSTGSCSNAILDDDTNATRSATAVFADLVPGSYTVTRTAVSGWALTALGCTTGESSDLGAGVATIVLTAGESTTCTFTNSAV